MKWREPTGDVHWHVYERHGYQKPKTERTFSTRKLATAYLIRRRDELIADGLPIISGRLSKMAGELGFYALGEQELYSTRYYELSGCACEMARCQTPNHDHLVDEQRAEAADD